MTDFLDRFIFDKKDLRACYVRLNQTLENNHAAQTYPPAIEKLLGEFMAACAALSSSLKYEGRLVLQLRSESDMPLIMAECNHQGELRSYAQRNTDCENIQFSDLSNGVLVFTLQPDVGESYQGIVPLDGNNLAECLQNYFKQSEQLESYFYILSEGANAVAFMVQQLPPQLEMDLEKRRDHWEEVQALSDTLRDEELLELDSKEIMHRLFHQDEVRFLERESLAFSCGCSKQKMEQALISVGKKELDDVLREQGRIDMQCEFCLSGFVFEKGDVEALFSEQKTVH